MWCLLYLCLAARVDAQIDSATLVGVVMDESDAGLPGAIVTVIATATRQSHVGVSQADGSYTIAGLVPGVYELHVHCEDFGRSYRQGVTVGVGETIRLDFRLKLRPLSEDVLVILDERRAQEATSLSHGVGAQEVVALPLNGRAFVSLVGLVPGVALPPGSLLPRINGGRPRVNEYIVDGISILQPEPGQVAFLPNVDAIQELRVETNSPPAEFGRFNGGVVNVETKMGTSDLHGTGFHFLRHEALNARNAFAPSGAARPMFRRQQFGGVVGGSLRRRETSPTYFFLDYQGQRQTIGRTVVSTVPTLLQRQGIFTEAVGGRVPAVFDPATTTGTTRQPFPGNVVPPDRMDPVAVALLQRYPLPTHSFTSNNYRRTGDESVNQDQISVRLDQRFASDSITARITRFAEQFFPVTPLPEGSGVPTGALGPQRTTAWSLASRYRRPLTSSVINDLRLGDTRRSVRRSATSLGAPVSEALGLRGIPTAGFFAHTLPTFAIAGYTPLGSPPNTASEFGTGVIQVADALSWWRGRHTVKIGADLRWLRLNVVQPPSPAGTFSFSSLFTDQPGAAATGSPLASFLLGQVQQFTIDLQRAPIRNRAHVHEYFAQDEWRVLSRVTLHGGVRYTLNVPSTEVDDQAAVFNLQTRQLEFLGRDGHARSARRLHTGNFGPRLAVAGRLSERALARVAYGMVWIDQTGITTPFTTPAFPFLQTVTQRTFDNITPAFTLAEGPTVTPIPLAPDAGLGQGVFAVDRDLGSGYVQQWHASLQRDLTSRVSLDVSYIGSQVTRVGVPDTNLNQLSVQQLALGDALLQRVPNPFFGQIPRSSSLGDPTIPLAQLLKPYPAYTTVSLYRNNVGTTLYQGLSVKLERRLSRGLSYLLSYTRSKLVDDASAVFDASVLTGPTANTPVADSFNRRLERDYSTGDIPHVLVISGVWQLLPTARLPWTLGWLLKDWSLSGVWTIQSGVPIPVTQATNYNAFAGFGTQRPHLDGDPTLPADQRSVSRWFNTDAFAAAPPYTLGSSSRNPVRGPGYRNLDLALTRRIPLSARTALELRVEAFNVTNTPALGAPNGVFGTPAFGTITTAGDPRVVQLAGKLLF